MLRIMKTRRTRARSQNGTVEIRGKRQRHYYGRFNVYKINEQGQEITEQTGENLGLCTEITKTQAKNKLRELIARRKKTPSVSGQTLEWFVHEKFMPSRSGRWRESTRATNLYYIEKLILPALGHIALCDLDKFDLQIFLNKLADAGYTFTVVDHCRTMLWSILDEAVDAELIQKNMAKKLVNPETTERKKEVLPLATFVDCSLRYSYATK
jgi:hypothetical protein